MPGRRPLSAEKKEARGNPGKRALRPNPVVEAGIPEPPQSVKDRPLALAEWNDIAKRMHSQHTMSPQWRIALRDVVISYAESERLLASLKATLSPEDYKDISIRALNWMKLGQVAGEKLGLNPAAHARIFAAASTADDASEQAARDFNLD